MPSLRRIDNISPTARILKPFAWGTADGSPATLTHYRHRISIVPSAALRVSIDACHYGRPACITTAHNEDAAFILRGTFGMKVLLVEGHRDVRIGLGLQLREQGHDVVECASGRDALLLAAYFEADLLVSGDVLPDMTCRQLVAELRQWSPQLSAPVVVLKPNAGGLPALHVH